MTALLISILITATPLLLAATGALVVERAGVLNLGVEGMMLMGAIAGCAVARETGHLGVALMAAIAAGMALSLVFAGLTLILGANQTASGLALTIFGRGFSALVGAGYIGVAAPTLPRLVIGDPLVPVALAMLGGVAWFLGRTHAGLILRAVGDQHEAAHVLGYRVIRIRALAILFGGGMAGLAGAYMSLAATPLWAQDMVAGRGWVAIALVTFAGWRPFWLLVGAWLFGGVMYFSLYLQGMGVAIPSALLSALPYLGTIFVLVLISRDRRRMRLLRPAMLGRPFQG
jgi:simple sugar transport system permease protein